MDQAKEQIKAAYGDKRQKYIPLWKIIDERWNKQLHRPLHAVDYYLNPRYHYTTNFEVDGEVLGGLYKCIERMAPDSKAQDQIHNKALNFSESHGIFRISMAIRNKAKKSPNASGCEQNWSVFERIHTKKRNLLEQKWLNDMVFVQYNLRLRRNQLLNKTPETKNIVLDDFDPTSEWVVESQLATFDSEDLSWLDLDPLPQDAEVDISEAPVATSRRGESSRNPIADLDATHSLDEDEEEDDSNDD
eukprot:PITA_04389